VLPCPTAVIKIPALWGRDFEFNKNYAKNALNSKSLPSREEIKSKPILTN